MGALEPDMASGESTAGRPLRKAAVAWRLAGMVAIMTALTAAAPPGAMVTGGPIPKLLYLGAFAGLIGLATWFLRLRGLSWADVGLRRPDWLRFALAIPVGFIATEVVVGVVRAVLAAGGVPGPDY